MDKILKISFELDRLLNQFAKGKVSKSEVETKRQELYQCIKEGVKTSENIA